MAQYLFFQESEHATWQVALAEERQNIYARATVPLVSVLDCDNAFTEPMTRADQAQIRYVGNFYADFDGGEDDEGLIFATEQVKHFIGKLEALGVDPACLLIHATGGRGYHVEVPRPCYAQRRKNDGEVLLPAIFKELAMHKDICVDALDLRVYSTRRLWRTPNVQRSNGHYKVQIAYQELVGITTPEQYRELCKAPRGRLMLADPVFSGKLAAMYAIATDKVTSGVKKQNERAAKRKGERSALADFNGEWPKSVERILCGEVNPDKGWNLICVQLALVSRELGKSEAELLEAARPLVNDYEGDGARYGSPFKRERELRTQYRFMQDNPCYDYSFAGIRSIMGEDNKGEDLRAGDRIPDAEPGETPVEAPKRKTRIDKKTGKEVEIASLSQHVTRALDVSRYGIFAITDDGTRRKVSDVGFDGARKICKDHKVHAYEVAVYLGGIPRGKEMIAVNSLSSRSEFQKVVMPHGGSLVCQDQTIAMLNDWFNHQSTTENEADTLLVTREGVDFAISDDDDPVTGGEIIWAGLDGIISTSGSNYHFRGECDASGITKSNILSAPTLQDTPESRQMVADLLNINMPHHTAKLIGWFVASFLCQPIRRVSSTFPSLQIFGQAGAGKSQSTRLLMRMFTFTREIKSTSAKSTTQWPINAAVSQSASIPIVFEEVKPREMDKRHLDFLLHILRSNYGGDESARGGVNRESGVSGTVIKKFPNVAPICFVGEAIMDQTAIMERCVIVNLSQQSRLGHEDPFERLCEKPHELGSIGRLLINAALATDVQNIRSELKEIKSLMVEAVGKDRANQASRPTFNQCVCVLGLRFLKSALQSVFGGHFNNDLARLEDTLFANASNDIPKVASEASKALTIMAYLTRVKDDQYRLEKMRDYTVAKDGTSVDLKLREAYDAYVRYSKSVSSTPLYDGLTQFVRAMQDYEGTMEVACPDNRVLYRHPSEPIFRISNSYMESEGCEPFAT